MNSKRFTIFVVGCLMLTAFAPQGFTQARALYQQTQFKGLEIGKLTGDVYYARMDDYVSAFMVTSEGIILVEPVGTEMAEWLKGEFGKRFKVPVKYVIYSHAHNDHASGGEVFADTATFVAHENMAKNLVQPVEGAPLLPRETLWDKNRNGGIEQSEAPAGLAKDFAKLDLDGNGRLTRRELWAVRFGGGAQSNPPDIVYRDFASITLGGKTVELHYTGLNHTDDMTVVRFPEQRIIYTVDHLTPKRLPRGDLDGGFLPEWTPTHGHVDTTEALGLFGEAGFGFRMGEDVRLRLGVNVHFLDIGVSLHDPMRDARHKGRWTFSPMGQIEFDF